MNVLCGQQHAPAAPEAASSGRSSSSAASQLPGALHNSDPCASLEFAAGLPQLWGLPRRPEPLVVVACGR
jgi:hypothetical protein